MLHLNIRVNKFGYKRKQIFVHFQQMTVRTMYIYESRLKSSGFRPGGFSNRSRVRRSRRHQNNGELCRFFFLQHVSVSRLVLLRQFLNRSPANYLRGGKKVIRGHSDKRIKHITAAIWCIYQHLVSVKTALINGL